MWGVLREGRKGWKGVGYARRGKVVVRGIRTHTQRSGKDTKTQGKSGQAGAEVGRAGSGGAKGGEKRRKRDPIGERERGKEAEFEGWKEIGGLGNAKVLIIDMSEISWGAR